MNEQEDYITILKFTAKVLKVNENSIVGGSVSSTLPPTAPLVIYLFYQKSGNMDIKYENKKYGSREEEIRAELTLEEVIARIKNYKFAEYDPDRPNFDAWDQLLTCEALAESTPVNTNYDEEMNENASVNGMINDSCKRNVVFELTPSKHKVITKLNQCNYRTPPNEIAILLEDFFKEWKSKSGHWVYISQHWTPRAINRTISRLIKLQATGKKTIQIPPAYFTTLIKFRKRRKS